MAAKLEHLDLRLDAETKADIAYAAKLRNSTVSHFALTAIKEAVAKELAGPEYTVMPAEQFDELLASLDVPDDAPRLRKLFADKA